MKYILFEIGGEVLIDEEKYEKTLNNAKWFAVRNISVINTCINY